MPRCPAHGKRPGSSGSKVSTTMVLSIRPSTSTPSSRFNSTSIACAVLPSVADSPHTGSAGGAPGWGLAPSCGPPPPAPSSRRGTAALCAARWRAKARRRASASCTWTPRLVPISSCHSSTTTSAMSESCARLSARDSMRLRLSGVVTRTSGSFFACLARSPASVSPERTATVQSRPRSASGSASARAVSAARARIGVSHSSRSPPPRTSPASARFRSANHSA